MSKERTTYFLTCIYCPVSVYEFGDTCISQETGDILFQNNIFTLKFYRNMNSFVPEALGDLPHLLFYGGVVRESFNIISSTARMYLEILGMSRVQKNKDNSRLFAVICEHCGGLLLKLHQIKCYGFLLSFKKPEQINK